MTTRLIVGLSCAFAMTACGGKKSDAPGSAPAKGTPTAKSPTSPKSPQAPVALPHATHTAPIDKDHYAFRYLDAHGGQGVGVLPDDGGTWTTRAAKDDRELAALTGFLIDQRDMGRAAAVDGLTAPPAQPAPANTDDDLAKALYGDGGPGEEEEPPPPPPSEEWSYDPYAVHPCDSALDEGRMGSEDRITPPLDAPPRVGDRVETDAEYAGNGTADPPHPSVPEAQRHGIGGYAQPKASHAYFTVLADAAAPATKLVEILDQLSQADLAVAGDGGMQRLVIGFEHGDCVEPYVGREDLWVELDASGATVRPVDGATAGTAAWSGDAVDGAALTAAYQKVRSAPKGRTDAHISVADGVTVARLVSVIDALVGAGVDEVVVRDWTRPVLHGLVLRGSLVSSVGDLDRHIIGRTMDATVPTLATCDATGVDGVFSLAFFIQPSGGVSDAKLDGAPAAFATCVAKAMSKAKFSAPKGGGGVQVSYRLAVHTLP